MKKLIVIACIFLASCELVKEVDVDSGPSKLVVNSVLMADSAWALSVTRTVHILDRQYFYNPEQVSFKVMSRAGEEVGFEEFVYPGGQLEYRGLQTPVAGETYTIEVSAPGFASVQSTATVPSRVELVFAFLDSANMIPYNYDNAGSIPVEFTFQDPPGRGDYYIPEFVFEYESGRYNPDTQQYERYPYWRSLSMTENVKTGGLSLEEPVRAISDEFFDGELRTVRLHINKDFWSSNEPKTYGWKFYLTHISEDYYKFLLSSEVQRETDGNPLAQPVQVFSNIEGGLGIFAGASTSTWKSPE
jgi:hypothetical protein